MLTSIGHVSAFYKSLVALLIFQGSLNHALATEAASNLEPRAVGVGYETVPPHIGKSIELIRSNMKTGVVFNEFELLAKQYAQYKKAQPSCISMEKVASQLCFEETSPQLQDNLQQINNLMSIAGTAASVNDACSSAAKALTLAKAGLSSYLLACGGARSKCESSCAQATKSAKGIVAAAQGGGAQCMLVAPHPHFAVCQQSANQINLQLKEIVSLLEATDNNSGLPQSVAAKTALCTHNFRKTLESAGAGLLTSILSLRQAKNCEKNTLGVGEGEEGPTAGGPTAGGPAMGLTPEMCAIPANANNPECLCIKNPRTPGCDNALAKIGEGNTDLAAGGKPHAANEKAKGKADFKSGNTPVDFKGSGGGFGSGGRGLAGGGGANVGGGGSGGPTGQDGTASGDLPGSYEYGFEGGGGGGGAWGAGGDEGGFGDSGLKAFMPGGEMDPSALAGSEGEMPTDITSSGGESNFKKVRARYLEATPSLLSP